MDKVYCATCKYHDCNGCSHPNVLVKRDTSDYERTSYRISKGSCMTLNSDNRCEMHCKSFLAKYIFPFNTDSEKERKATVYGTLGFILFILCMVKVVTSPLPCTNKNHSHYEERNKIENKLPNNDLFNDNFRR